MVEADDSNSPEMVDHVFCPCCRVTMKALSFLYRIVVAGATGGGRAVSAALQPPGRSIERE
jgi:hypothetical protein